MLFGLTIALIVACRSPQVWRPDNWPEVLGAARSVVLAELVDLDELSRAMLHTNEPNFFARGVPFGSYYQFQWIISSNRTVELSGTGDCTKLERSHLYVFASEKDRYGRKKLLLHRAIK